MKWLIDLVIFWFFCLKSFFKKKEKEEIVKVSDCGGCGKCMNCASLDEVRRSDGK